VSWRNYYIRRFFTHYTQSTFFINNIYKLRGVTHMNQFRKFLSGLVALTTALSLTGLGLSSVSAAQLTSASATVANPSSGVSTSYTFDFLVASAGNIGEIDFQFSNTATGATVPTNLVTTSSTKTSVTGPGGAETANWTLVNATNGLLKMTQTPASYSAGAHLVFVFGAINSNTTVTDASQCDAVVDSDSCFLQIRTFAVDSSGGAGTAVDKTTVTYTVINPITVSATVDPILIFTVSGVASGSVAGNDANAGVAGSTAVTSTSTTLPFGNVTVGQKKVTQQKLDVETNANNGYNVYQRFLTTNYMIGSANASNHFSPFVEGTATWASPKAWATPTGSTANTNTAEIGLRTTDAAVSGGGFGTSDFYGPPTNTANGNLVKTSTTPDNGASGTSKYVSYKVEANAFQPADSYSGSMVYSVVASY
jgi:hypothetical protein